MKDLSNENIIHVKKNNIEYLQFRKFLNYKDIISHAYSVGIDKNYRTARKDGNISKEEYETAIKNYKELCDEINVDSNNVIKTLQAHTDNIMIVKNKEDFNLEKTKVDALCTNFSKNVLATTNADCILLLLFDPIKRVIANVHSGWRGTLQRIIIKTVDKMKDEYGCEEKDIICCICPSIRKCHFEVDEDVKNLFENEFSELLPNADIIEKDASREKWYIDTVLINKILLKEKGLKEENIIDSNICSVCHKDLIHSYRAEGEKYGLNTAIISLK